MNGNKIAYPAAKKGNVVDDYNGVKIADPYRSLEDTNSSETTAWVEAENKVTQAYLAQIPQRDKIRKRLTELFDYERYPSLALDEYAGVFQAGGRHFIFRNSGLQNQYVLYVLDQPASQERVLLDPNLLRADGTAALNALSVDHSGKLLAYSISQAGSDWSEFHVRDIATAKDLPDHLQWTKFTNAAWTHDGRAFYYQRFPEPDSKKALTASNENARLYLHRIGEPQSADKLVYERPDQPKWIYGQQVSDDGRYLVISVFGGDESWNLLFYQDLESKQPKTIELINQPKAKFSFLGNDGSKFYVHTTDSAPKGRIIAIDVNHPERANWKEIVSEQSETLESAQLIDGKLVLSYLKDAHAQLKVTGLDGKSQREVALPGLGTVDMSPAYSTDTEMFYSFTSYTSPAVIYRYDLRSNRSAIYRQSKLSFDPSQYESEQVFYNSKDGTRVPMFLVHRKGLKRDGQNPTL
ncbi:MAG TPA: S9 family peptidase, partial [Terriglobales bacterium]|nr:S9 family peptidase [Terriglobales bacterium]